MNAEDMYATLMSHSEFHKEVVDKYVIHLKKYKNGSSSFINDGIRKYCKTNNIKDNTEARIECVKFIDKYIRTEIKLGNKG